MDLKEIYEWLSDRDNVTFIIAVVGFAMSIYNFIESWLHKRTKVAVEFAHVFRVEGQGRCVDILHLKIYNLSSREIVISRISVKNNSGNGEFGAYRRQLLRSAKTLTRSSGEIDLEAVTWMSDYLPVKVEGGGFANLLLMADADGRIIGLNEPNIVILHTPSNTVRKKLTISDFSERGLLGECRAPD